MKKAPCLILSVLAIASVSLADTNTEAIALGLYNDRPATNSGWYGSPGNVNRQYFADLARNKDVEAMIAVAATTNAISRRERYLVVAVLCSVKRPELNAKTYSLYSKALKRTNPWEWCVKYQTRDEWDAAKADYPISAWTLRCALENFNDIAWVESKYDGRPVTATGHVGYLYRKANMVWLRGVTKKTDSHAYSTLSKAVIAAQVAGSDEEWIAKLEGLADYYYKKIQQKRNLQ